MLTEKKQSRVDDFRQWLMDNDIEFTEHANGHFQIYVDGNKLMDIWATTEKGRIITGDKMAGMYFIKKSIIAHRDAYWA